MGRNVQFFDNRITEDLPSTTPTSVYAPRVREHRHQKVTQVNVENVTSNATKLRIFIERGGTKHYKAEQLAPIANSLYVEDRPLHLTQNDRLGVEYTGHTDGDKIVLTYEGFESDNPFMDYDQDVVSR